MLTFSRSMFLILILFTVGCQSTTIHCDLVTVEGRRIEVSESRLSELKDQLSGGKLSQHEVNKVTNKALVIQGDLDKPWSRAWGNWTPYLGHKPAIGEVTHESPEDKLVRIRQGIQQDKQARDIDDYNFDVERGEEDPTDLLMEELSRQKAISMDRERQQKLREGVNMQQPTTPYRYPRGGH